MKSPAEKLPSVLLVHTQIRRHGRRIVKTAGCFVVSGLPSLREYRPMPLRPPWGANRLKESQLVADQLRMLSMQPAGF